MKKLLFALALSVALAGLTSALPLASSTAQAQSNKNPYIFDLLKKPAYQAAWRTMLRGRRAPLWVRQASGPSGPSTIVQIDGRRYRLADVCKAHDCGDNQFRVLFSRGGKRAWGAMQVAGRKIRYYGRPSASLRRALAAAFRR